MPKPKGSRKNWLPLEKILENRCHAYIFYLACHFSLFFFFPGVNTLFDKCQMCGPFPSRHDVFFHPSFTILIQHFLSLSGQMANITGAGVYLVVSLQMISTGSSGRLTCSQDTHSLCANMDKGCLHTRSTRQSGGSQTDTHTSSLETGASFRIMPVTWKRFPSQSLHYPLNVLLCPCRYWRYNEETRRTDRDFPKPNSRWGRIPDAPKGAFLSDDSGTQSFSIEQKQLLI